MTYGFNQTGGYYFCGEQRIGADEYKAAVLVIKQKNDFVERVHAGVCTMEDVPEQWQEEILRRVSARRAEEKLPAAASESEGAIFTA